MATKAEQEQANRLRQLHNEWRDPKKTHPDRVEVLEKTWERDGRVNKIKLDYIGHANLRDLLCTADPHWSWAPMGRDATGAPVVDKDSKGWSRGLWITLTVHGVTKPGYGSCEAGKQDAVKELIGDALRNAAQSFGIAVALWAKIELAELEGYEDLPLDDPAPPPAPEATATPAPEPQAAAVNPPLTPEPQPPADPPAQPEAPQPATEAPVANGNGQAAPMDRATLEVEVGTLLKAMRGDQARKFSEYRKQAQLPGDLTTATEDQLAGLLAWLQGQPVSRVAS